jgi:hypothetical protein
MKDTPEGTPEEVANRDALILNLIEPGPWTEDRKGSELHRQTLSKNFTSHVHKADASVSRVHLHPVLCSDGSLLWAHEFRRNLHGK